VKPTKRRKIPSLLLLLLLLLLFHITQKCTERNIGKEWNTIVMSVDLCWRWHYIRRNNKKYRVKNFIFCTAKLLLKVL
jgi:hypothetical protein